MKSHRSFSFGAATRLLALTALAAALPAQALYKVIAPDGKVTYTDRLPGPGDGKVAPLGTPGAGAADSSTLPFELRQAAARYPVTLFVFANCTPCDAGRALLRQRGIPHAEKQVLTEDDAEALQRLTGSREAPTLVIGTQPLRGLSSESWNAYLDAAGYPRESRLPPGFEFPPATPLTQKREPPRPAPAAAPAPNVPTEPAAPSGIRF